MIEFMSGVVIMCSVVGSVGVTAGIAFRREIAEMAASEKSGFYGDRAYLAVIAASLLGIFVLPWLIYGTACVGRLSLEKMEQLEEARKVSAEVE